MKSFCEIYGIPFSKSSSNLYGVEIEVEGLGDPRRVAGWDLHNDGSLRGGGYEYVSRVPSSLLKSKKMLLDLRETLDSVARDQGKELNFSDRCSIHIHVDTRNMTAYQVFKMLCLYLVFENPIYHLGGWERKNNNYCPPLGDSLASLQLIGSMSTLGYRSSDLYMRSGRIDDFMTFLGGSSKYSGVNISAIKSFGSIEFRMHESTPDFERVFDFLSLLHNLKIYCKKSGNVPVRSIAPRVTRGEAAMLASEVFGKQALNLVNTPSFESHCYNGARNVLHCIKLSKKTDKL